MSKTFVSQCRCGATIHAVNAKFVADGPTCNHCQQVLDGTDAVYEPAGMVVCHMDWCSCGTPEVIDEAMVAYLDSDDDGILRSAPDAETMLLAYIADHLGWTAHGGSIHGAWLTDDGREALANLKALMEVQR